MKEWTESEDSEGGAPRWFWRREWMVAMESEDSDGRRWKTVRVRSRS